jgi:predicted GNAT family N-acyltransferase
MNGSTRTVIGTWDELGKDAALVRTEVFVGEQGIAPELEWDELDTLALHAVVYFDANDDTAALPKGASPIGTGRLIAPGLAAPEAKIGRMAVLKAHRRSGVGDDVLQALLDAAYEAHYPTVALSAQSYVSGFYERHGFEVQGDEYVEVGIPHKKMILNLPG